MPAVSKLNHVGQHTKAHRPNSTFGFCRHKSQRLKKPKELFFARAKKH
jgi:hypothetical protein